ncbi:Spx/MgsR family transcriptional regulator [Psychrobacter sp. PL15]|jgi:Spx/MgsR family transcriptional regulator|uniref:Spx/MgsR family RNA polymerase-binding regulatory protein n=1 Tax=unclassified Psychrobacter TaxID=196806 RepID=UPI001AEA134D|nr:Spx/MgsR family RNA polymerase-binding regulatory protein [Psychrobacter sp. PL15]MEC5210286.1 Spx/MgsR family transcriptional regulator [Psychrobacter sp. PL15]
MTITIYGIKSCSTMKKAFIKLEELGVNYDFHDYKKRGIDQDSVQRWVDLLGLDQVLNKRGTTWRNLSDEQKAAADANDADAIELLLANTSMLKRPIVEGQLESKNQARSVLLCGFDAADYEANLL